MPVDRSIMRDHFRRMDAALSIAAAEAKKIKQKAPAYWEAQGIKVQPRLEALRKDVFNGRA